MNFFKKLLLLSCTSISTFHAIGIDLCQEQGQQLDIPSQIKTSKGAEKEGQTDPLADKKRKKCFTSTLCIGLGLMTIGTLYSQDNLVTKAKGTTYDNTANQQLLDNEYSFGGVGRDILAERTPLASRRLLKEQEGYFLKIFSWENRAHGYSMIETKKGDFVSAGIVGRLGGSVDILLNKLDSNGTLLWTKTLTAYPSSSYAHAIMEARNGDLFLTGQIRNSNINKHYLLISRLTGNGTIIWNKNSYITNSDIGFSIIEMSNGDLVLTAQTYISVYAILVSRLDGNGNVIWEKTFSHDRHIVSPSIIEANNSDLVLVAKTYDKYNVDNILVSRLDGNGNVIWERIFSGDDRISASSIIEMSNGDLVLTGKAYGYVTTEVSILIGKISFSGDIIWATIFSHNDTNHGTAITETNNGELVLTGAMFGGIIVSRLSADSNLLWVKTLELINHAYSSAIIETSDDDLFFNGAIMHNGRYSVLISKISGDNTTEDCATLIYNADLIDITASISYTNVSLNQTFQFFNLSSDIAFQINTTTPDEEMSCYTVPPTISPTTVTNAPSPFPTKSPTSSSHKKNKVIEKILVPILWSSAGVFALLLSASGIWYYKKVQVKKRERNLKGEHTAVQQKHSPHKIDEPVQEQQDHVTTRVPIIQQNNNPVLDPTASYRL